MAMRAQKRHKSVPLNPDNPMKYNPTSNSGHVSLTRVRQMPPPPLTPLGPFWKGAAAGGTEMPAPSVPEQPHQGRLYWRVQPPPSTVPWIARGKPVREGFEMNAAREHWYHIKYLLILQNVVKCICNKNKKPCCASCTFLYQQKVFFPTAAQQQI